MKKILLALMMFTLLLSACQNAEPEELLPPEEVVEIVTPEPEPEPELEPEPEPEEEEDPGPDLTGLSMNPITGHFICEDAALRRPIAVVIDNIFAALPQSGISQADIIYETLAEGGTTRLVAIFTTASAEKIGPVRSTRHNFLDFALNHDAILIHHGGSPQGYSAINNLRADSLDGMHGFGAFFRDQSREQGGWRPLEHSSFITASGIYQAIEDRNLRQEIHEEFTQVFEFLDDDCILEGEKMHEVIVTFAGSQIGRFHYIEGVGVYLRTQNGNPHFDEYTGQQLVVENVLIQYARMRIMDYVGRRDVTLVGEGRGTLHTRGVAVPVRWSRESNTAPTIWTFENGEPMRLTRGKTWVCIMPE